MRLLNVILKIYLLFLLVNNSIGSQLKKIDAAKTLVWGVGLDADNITLPARYFFIHTVDINGEKLTRSPGSLFDVTIIGNSDFGSCRAWINQLDRKDGSFIVRYKLYSPCYGMQISVKYKDQHVAESPYKITGTVYNEECYCPEESITNFLQHYKCKSYFPQIKMDLKPFQIVNYTLIRNEIITRYNAPGAYSLCNYVIKNNRIYRKCYGQHVGFKMFVDAILLSLTRKVILPDMELFVNLGDWPLVKKSDFKKKKALPIFSWCGSDDSLDIVLPTYDLTESTLQNMGRVMLDMLSVQGNTDLSWLERREELFWRGRDSRRERLDLIDIARKHPNMFNVSLTNFFFFRNEEDKYGPKVSHVSFFKFFDYKYQLNIDGTVAAYRFPYLLIGGSLIFKQESPYYEHFYHELEPNKHYIPVKRDLSNLIEKIKWAKANDDAAQKIAQRGRQFAIDNLLPHDIICYHLLLLNEWSKVLVSDVKILDGMELVEQPVPDHRSGQCICHKEHVLRDLREPRDEL